LRRVRPEGDITESTVHDFLQHHWVPRLMFLLLPASALLVAVTTRRSGRNLPQHLYFVVHVHAAVFGVMAVRALIGSRLDDRLDAALGVVFLLFVARYLATAFHVAYGGSWRRATFRAAAAGGSYFIIVMLATVAVFVAAMLL
jgi:hypothetical protein